MTILRWTQASRWWGLSAFLPFARHFRWASAFENEAPGLRLAGQRPSAWTPDRALTVPLFLVRR